jgi:hypothetical protein
VTNEQVKAINDVLDAVYGGSLSWTDIDGFHPAMMAWFAAGCPRVEAEPVHPPCPICGGNPPLSGLPCACGGTNRLDAAFEHLHDEWARLVTPEYMGSVPRMGLHGRVTTAGPIPSREASPVHPIHAEANCIDAPFVEPELPPRKHPPIPSREVCERWADCVEHWLPVPRQDDGGLSHASSSMRAWVQEIREVVYYLRALHAEPKGEGR